MKLLNITITAVVLVGCGESQQSAPAPETKPAEPVAQAATPEPSTAKAPDISIQEAAEQGNIEAVKQHLAAGTDVNEYSMESSALYRASVEGHFEIVELLLANGAEVNLGFKGVWQLIPMSPLDVSTSLNYPKISDLLRKNGGKHASIHGAAEGGDIDSVKDFLASGVDVDAVDQYKQTALHLAKTLEIAELLISKGADVNAETDIGITPLDLAHGEIADLLRKHGGKTGEELKAEGK